ncbi:MAG: sigma-70 family RNA polymerase sigma factor [Candidatus Limnocylindrales bacterium]
MAALLVLESAVEALTLPAMSSSQPSRMSSIDIVLGADGLESVVLDLERRHGQALFGFVRRLGLDDAQAADAVQDVLLRLWAELVAGRSIEQPKAWAFRAIYRLAMDQHRLQRRIGAITERLGRSGAAWQDTPGDAGDRLAVWAEVDRLPERQRNVLYLRYRADLSFDQIGSVMGITASAARSHATQATATLRRRLGDESNEAGR